MGSANWTHWIKIAENLVKVQKQGVLQGREEMLDPWGRVELEGQNPGRREGHANASRAEGKCEWPLSRGGLELESMGAIPIQTTFPSLAPTGL